MAERATLRIEQPGMLTTVQDLGRSGQARYGVAPGGALDRTAVVLGNRLLGNEPGAAALEITLIGPKLCFSRDTAITITGGDLGAKLGGHSVPLWRPLVVPAGETVTFDPGSAQRGARAYLCIAGGIEVEPVLGSRSTALIGGFGGWQGRALRAGDVLPLGMPEVGTVEIARRRLAVAPPAISSEIVARIVLGPQADRFTAAGIATLLESEFAVTSKSNRQGVRLQGPVIAHATVADMVSEGIAHGAIQVPGDGQPIVLLAGRQTVGGYVKIATVIGADLDRFAQLRPGDRVRFASVSVAEARAATLKYREMLESEPVIEVEASMADSDSTSGTMPSTEDVKRLGGAWDPAGVIRVIEALERAGATSFSLKTHRLSLNVTRGADDWSGSTATGGGETISIGWDRGTVVTAPVIGVLYRRSAPGEPLLADVGQNVKQGQVICILEVMKTYHEVTAQVEGKLVEFLVEDGQFVEYGQAIARIASE